MYLSLRFGGFGVVGLVVWDDGGLPGCTHMQEGDMAAVFGCCVL